MRVAVLLGALLASSAVFADEWVYAPANTYAPGSAPMAAIDHAGYTFAITCLAGRGTFMFIPPAPLHGFRNQPLTMAVRADNVIVDYAASRIDSFGPSLLAVADASKWAFKDLAEAKQVIEVALLSPDNYAGVIRLPVEGASKAVGQVKSDCAL